MRYYFLDTSALVKIYCTEPGSRKVRDLVRSASRSMDDVALLVCDIALPEGASALVHKAMRREDGVVPANVDRLIDRLQTDLIGSPTVFVVIESSPLMGDTVAIARQYGLTGADAVHLAAALAARASMPLGYEFYFASTDTKLVHAARIEGFRIMEEILPAPAGN